MRKIIVAMLAIWLHFHSAHAQQISLANQNLLISKLETVYKQLPSEDPSKTTVALRLADLYAERARQVSNQASDGCLTCKEPQNDREKALKLYSDFLARSPESLRGKIMMQMGHLHQLNGQEDKALSLYMKNLDPKTDPSVLAEAHLSLAEIYFKRHEFNKAMPHYSQVMAISSSPSRGFAAYRNAWSYFYLKQIPAAVAAMEALMKSPELLTRSNGNQTDSQFHEEVSRDYVTFLAQTPVSNEKVEALLNLSPASTKLINGQALAYELERIGKRDEALLTWNILASHLSQPNEKLASRLATAQLHLDKNEKAQALKDFSEATAAWSALGHTDSPLEQELSRRARHFVVSWNQMEKLTPSPELYSAYERYLSVFPSDVDAQLYAAQIAAAQNNYVSAINHYVIARDLLLSGQMEAGKLEDVLLSQIEIAESSKDAHLAQQAYSAYIQFSPKKTKLLEVQYQKARALYDQGDYAHASVELKNLATAGQSNLSLRKQAADLSLDALVLMKDENNLMNWAREYQNFFVDHKSDFAQIVQKGLLTKSAQLAEKDPSQALAVLAEFDPTQATVEDQIKYQKNRLILAEKQKDLNTASAAADALLAIPQASKEDREYAWARKAYFAELRLDFPTAFAATEKLEKTLPADEKNFKLAIFAELSGRQSANYYMSYLTQAKDMERKQLVALELVRKAKNPDIEVEKVRHVLAGDPNRLAQAYVEAFAKTGKEVLVKKVAADPKLRDTDAGKLLARHTFLKDFASIKKSLMGDKLNTNSSNKLASSIKHRAQLLSKAEDFAKKSIQSADWTAQLVILDLLAKESERFYQDLLSAPLPQGLSPEEEQQYLSILSSQAAPYQIKATEAKEKVNQFWTNSDWVSPLMMSWQQPSIRPLIQAEVAALREIAPADAIVKLEPFKDSETLAQKPSTKEIELARQAVFNNPLDSKALEELLKLERKSDNKAMSDYLATRLETLNKKEILQ